jgi:hypothetical protein
MRHAFAASTVRPVSGIKSMIPKKPALGLDHRKSDVSDLRPFKNARTREYPSSGGGYRFSENIMLRQKARP